MYTGKIIFSQISLADRIILQMDQTEPENKIILWHLRKCSKNPDMDSSQCLCTDCDY